MSLAAYLLNMAIRLMPMRRVLSDQGSIYLHCDPTASHYLKLIMDAIFGIDNFLNEVVWERTIGRSDAERFARVHDSILYYRKGAKAIWNGSWQELTERQIERDYKHKDETGRRFQPTSLTTQGLTGGGYYYSFKGKDGPWRYPEERMLELEAAGRIWTPAKEGGWPRYKRYADESKGVAARDVVVDIAPEITSERLGYPTQKPIALLRRIIEASSNPGDLVLDPFCGCGTTVHAAEELGRRWVGIDVSSFSVGLMKERILANFRNLKTGDILSIGVPTTVSEAKALAERDKFEFEKWVCGEIGAEGMFHDPGTRGADGGVDGVLKFFPIPETAGKKLTVKPEYAIVQVKGGRVTPDAVHALKARVDKYGVKAGVMVCFNEYMGTVENQRSQATFRDAVGTYPVIQGLSIEELLDNKRPDLPLYGRQRQGGLISALR